MSCIPEPAMQSCDTGQQIPFCDSCQLITTWMSNTKFYKDSIKVCHFASANMKGWTYVPTYHTDDFLKNKISWKHRLPYFLAHGAPLRARESSAIRVSWKSTFESFHSNYVDRGVNYSGGNFRRYLLLVQ